MSISHKLKTALQIFKSRGIKGVVKTIQLKFNRAYSPNEIQLLYELLSENVHAGLMVDVGAGRGASLTPFAEGGWTVIAFEPDLTNRGILSGRFESYPNVRIDSRACSDLPQLEVTLYTSKESTGVSSLYPFLHSHVPSHKVNVTTLESALLDHDLADKRINLLKIDTEGYDLRVLQGYPWSTSDPPDVILCEFEDAKTIPLGYCLSDMVNFLLSKAYHLIISEWYPIRSYGGAHHWRCFSSYPYTLLDAKDWGNIIAVKDDRCFEELCRICQLAKPKQDHHKLKKA